MNKNSKLWAIVSYITWIGFILAFLLRDKDDSLVHRHLNQALILNIAGTVGNLISRIGGIFGTIGTVIDIAILVLAIMGIVRAARGSEEPLPLVGDFTLIP